MTVKFELDASLLPNMLWCGALDTVKALTLDECMQVLAILDECQPKEGFTLTDVNDFFWFERDTIADWLGYNDFEEILNR